MYVLVHYGGVSFDFGCWVSETLHLGLPARLGQRLKPTCKEAFCSLFSAEHPEMTGPGQSVGWLFMSIHMQCDIIIL